MRLQTLTIKGELNGYDEEYDEWRDNEELVDLTGQTENPKSDTDTDKDFVYSPFSLYSEFGTKIKVSLKLKYRWSAEETAVRIELPFDKLLFEGGIKACGTPSRYYRGGQRYR